MNQGLSADTTLSHHRILEKVAAGGMGDVWRAEDTRLKRKVALKLLPAETTADGYLDYVYGAAGRRAEAQRVLQELSELSKRRY